MLGSIYTALAGMNAYSQGLGIVSNNVANLNTPGFKVSDPLFREIVYRQIAAAEGNGGELRPRGAGVEADEAGITFSQGELRETGNALDAAIDGDGFFVIEQQGAYRYTRAGQFTFNDEGLLVERTTGATVLIGTAGLANGTFNITSARTDPPQATTAVTMTGVLARTGTSGTHEVSNITVYDASGTAIALRGKFTRDTANPLQWIVEILGAANAVLGSGTISFNADGTPAQGANSVTVTVPSTTADSFAVAFEFGEVGSYAGVTSPAASSASTVQGVRRDGRLTGSLSSYAFDEQGALKLSYSNGQTRTVGNLVLAQFDNPERLLALGGGMFTTKDDAQPRLGNALRDGLGKVTGMHLEMSNVELTRQFTDLIILQRGYQASSQVSSIANELIQTLLAMDSSR